MGLVNEEMDITFSSHQDELEAISQEVINVNHRLEHLYDAIETGKIDVGDLTPRIRDLRQRQEKLMAQRAQVESYLSDRRVVLASPDVVRSYVEDLRNLLNRSELAERRAFIRSFIKEVKVTGNDVLVSYTVPVTPNEVSEEELGVLSTVHYGGRYWI